MRARASSFSDEATCYVHYILPKNLATQRLQPKTEISSPKTKKEAAINNNINVNGSSEDGFSLIETK